MSPQAFATTLALIGVVILVAALLSGLIERIRMPQVALFILLGLVLGPFGLGLISFTAESAVLRTVAILGLVLVLFTDAVSVDLAEVRRHRNLALLVLGPGTLLSAAAIGLVGWVLLDLPPAAAAILGAALASTDPVMMRGLLRRSDVPSAARQALGMESGLNDAVALPIVLAAMTFLGPARSEAATGWGRLALDLFVLGPAGGVLVGLVGVALLDLVRRRVGVRRDYESLYALGVAFTAFAVAEAAHGSGFLAAFAAGLTVAAFDTELCDCFLDYGQATAEMFLLFTFVALGSSAIWSGLRVLDGRTLVFAGVALFLRSAVLYPALAGAGLDPQSRRLITWFGPRGLSSLLLVLLPLFAGVPGSERLLAVASLVVLLSVVVHGGSLMLIGRGGALMNQGAAAPGTLSTAPASDGIRISLAELRRLEEQREAVVLIDVRTTRGYEKSASQARGAVRLPPDNAAPRAAELALPRHAWLVAYCA